MNIVYVGIPNPLRVISEKIPCNSLWLSCQNGTPNWTEDCRFDLIPRNNGRMVITVSSIHKRDTVRIDSAIFHAWSLPPPIAKIGGKAGGSIRANILKAQVGLVAYLDGFDYDVRLLVKSYKLIIFKKSGTWKEFYCTTGYFDSDVREALRDIIPGDHLLAYNIIADGPSRNGIALASLHLSVTE